MNRKPVQVVAHRGFSGKYPENTALAFTKALELGVEMVEIDVHLAKDRSLILIHDDSVERTSNGTGRVADLTLDEIKTLDAGSWMDPAFAGERFLTLSEALDLMGGKTRLNIHIKAYESDRDLVVPPVVQEIERRNLRGSCFVASDGDSLFCAKRVQPSLVVCNLSTTPRDTYIPRSLALGCAIIQPGNQQVDGGFVAEAHRHGLEVNPFYADEEPEMRRLIACGVDGILTNWPDRLLAIRG